MEAVAIVGSFSALFISILTLFYNFGKISARLEALEGWRKDIRNDMHEMSELLQKLTTEIAGLNLLIRERTDRRKEQRYESTS